MAFEIRKLRGNVDCLGEDLDKATIMVDPSLDRSQEII